MDLRNGGQRLLADEHETRAFGAELVRGLASGDVILLIGDLGAGKTTLVQGLAAELGVSERVTSPTFALCNVYPSRLGDLHHYDLYRLQSPRELPALGIEESLSTAGLTLIEWPELALPMLRGSMVVVRLCHDDNGRRVRWSRGTPGTIGTIDTGRGGMVDEGGPDA